MASAFGTTAVVLASLARAMPSSTLRRPPADFLMRPAPSPADILRDIPLPPRVRAALERAVLHEALEGGWTVGRLLAIPGFGLRSLQDAVATAVRLRQTATHPQEGPQKLEDELAPFLVARPRLWPRPPTPLLERAIALIGDLAPASEEAVLTALRAHGLSRGEATLAQLERASRFVEAPIPYAILRRGDLCLVVPGPDLALTQRVYGLAVRTVVSWGLAQIGHLAEQAGTDRHEFVVQVVKARPSFRWLAQSSGWFWFAAGESRLVRSIEKVLMVSAPISSATLARAVFQRRPPEFVPPLSVLEALCRQVPCFSVDETGHIGLASPEPELLSEEDRGLIDLFRARGPRIEAEQCQTLAQTVGLTADRLLRRLAVALFVIEQPPGVFQLVSDELPERASA